MRFRVWAERIFGQNDIDRLKSTGHYNPDADDVGTFSEVAILPDGSISVVLSDITPPIVDINMAKGVVGSAIRDALMVGNIEVSLIRARQGSLTEERVRYEV